MKGALFFRLPEDREHFNYARLGSAYKIALEEMDSYLRGRLKYEALPKDVREAIQKARDALSAYVTDAEDR